MEIKESGEMYLETILVLHNSKGLVRSIDVSEYMNFSKPSVSRAMGILKNNGYIIMDKDGYISLTEKGKNTAEKIYERHRVLSSLLMDLGVPEDIATEDACKVEHVISDETFEALKKYNQRRK